jgi:hypothetical protein
MERIEKTVFISYRRKDIYHAVSVFQNLTQHGYDVFFDFTGIGRVISSVSFSKTSKPGRIFSSC